MRRPSPVCPVQRRVPDNLAFIDGEKRQYDLAGELLELAHRDAGGFVQRRYAYEYDAAGNRVAMDDDQGRHAYGYDDKYQVVSATHPLDPSESFTYDPVGNRLSSHLSSSYVYNAANQLLDDAEFTYSYDADGNCTGKISKVNGERHEYVFNSENRMTAYRKYDIGSNLLTSADYYYDALGRRIAKSVNGLLTRYIYHGEDIWAELAPDGQVQRTYAHGPGIDEPIATAGADSRLYYYLADGLGTIRHIRDDNTAAFNIVATFNYDSFGQLLPSSSTGWNDAYRYTSREWDPETGTYFYRARYYDPHSGRFTAEDPLDFKSDVNHYRYVRNSPADSLDPFGLCCTALDRTRELFVALSICERTRGRTFSAQACSGDLFKGAGYGCEYNASGLVDALNGQLKCWDPEVIYAGWPSVSSTFTKRRIIPHAFVKLVPKDKCCNEPDTPPIAVDNCLGGCRLAPFTDSDWSPL
ncbi:MAG: RHS repeat-associated core domain-containing protein [Acidobacteria bacterium]|nr:RHS repeat-associated core domain-containing protein [Acidobacteriota bacterium]